MSLRFITERQLKKKTYVRSNPAVCRRDILQTMQLCTDRVEYFPRVGMQPVPRNIKRNRRQQKKKIVSQ